MHDPVDILAEGILGMIDIAAISGVIYCAFVFMVLASSAVPA